MTTLTAPSLTQYTQKEAHRISLICAMEQALQQSSFSIPGKAFPVRHFYHDGMYYRECFIPAGTFVIGKIHKYPHIVKCSYGRAEIYDFTGRKMVQPPFTYTSEAGVKRLVRALENHSFTTIWNLDKYAISFVDDPVEMGNRLSYLAYTP